MITKRKPCSVGEILREEFLSPLNMTQKELSIHLGCDIKVINRLVNEKTSLTVEMALKLGAAFNISPKFWINAQTATGLYFAKLKIKKLPKSLIKAS